MKKVFKAFSQETGNVIVEFTFTSIAILIPIAFVSVSVLRVASGYIEVQEAARNAARVFASSSNESLGKSQARQVVLDSIRNEKNVFVTITCSHNPCLIYQEIVTVRVDKEIDLNFPTFSGKESITVTGIQAEVIQETRW